ncbi:hypothetical protein LEP1GSC062_4309 [Leptospira alexanderi serovar Manhao 3 str. L 60]|uniref:Uncharacterized protein n=1 Tax=Leptospira alexanderi serovar Manhao 3 str. L 60 TaxID=1049759 RepID=V6HWR0_9LEPT|nr:hypothetical protein [Leptospira alexanderi]EQA61427.1 hypothetical protein LEP1GSC062_4309 [Leptospira alexanderi serovar Manhao 3 str. L 60]
MKSFKNDYLKDNQIRQYVDLKLLEEISTRITVDSYLQSQILTKLNSIEKGVPFGVATLDSDGLLLSNQRPSSNFEKTLISKGQLVTRDASGNFISVSPGLNNEILIFDSSSQGGFKPASLGSLFSLPGMKTLCDYVRQTSPFTNLFSAGNRTLDCSTSNLFRITGGNATITFSNMTENEVVNVVFESTGSPYTITWSGGTFLWSGAIIPTPSSLSGRKDFYSFIKVGGQIFSSGVLNMG